MSDDIVERLRRKVFVGPTVQASHTKTVEWQAADEIESLRADNKHIERMWLDRVDTARTNSRKIMRAHDEIKRLRAENERLRAALELADGALSGANMNMKVVERKARAALGEEKK